MECTSEKNFMKLAISRQDTGQGTGMPKPMKIPRYFAHVLNLPAKDNLTRFGVYKCWMVLNDIATEIVTFKLPPSSLADLEAVSPYVVASIGGVVELKVKETKAMNLRVKWMHDGNELPNWDGITTVQFVGIETKDAGIYECFYEGRRGEGVHALMRVIVRSCPKDFYGDDCDQECPPCYNGGVCHDKWGVCVCPAGFSGPNCENACGGNRYGTDCNQVCAQKRQDPRSIDELCSLYLFCKPDPYGCSCFPGYKGSKCSEQCEPGWYGADCKQHCHCALGVRSCNSMTGECEGGCLIGFRGPSCQIEVELDAVPSYVEARVGDSVEIRVVPIKRQPLPVKWMHDGKELPGWDGLMSVKLVDIKLKDSGTYECYYEGRREKNAHAISKVNVIGCQNGRFGDNCQYTCHCIGGSRNCDKFGFCFRGCEAGWTGETCQRPCWYKNYGLNCRNTCACANGALCDKVDGSCQCVGKWTGKNCNETLPETDVVPSLTEDPLSGCQCNTSAVWTYLHQLRGAVTHHLNHLQQRQVELERAISRIERRVDEQREIKHLTLPRIPHAVESTMDAEDITTGAEKSRNRRATTQNPISHTLP